ncbi:NAD(P)-dependent oxidoreductase [Pseudoxanthomonas sp. PXM02]|uniref:NAD-dependent epimerase/dehydratase family protein n=1 Tax=Pseudoxanthomonas sp. PXM02 TaxID=2769294 RepID=UPI00177BA897|nr:NAD(P)-dependent oxidoreductase [Pseudoxanthomonas sp. PXM02]MBD9477528.1 NAD(P)-dependent oxidoreductase [Pseudoxanthomonas sp. PXM02]
MARILVTGATGFIGSHAVRRLADAGHAIVATGRDRARLASIDTRAHAVVADLTRDPLEPLLHACDTVVHCAALSSPWGRSEDFESANVHATERLLDAARREGVSRFIHLGSPSIYFRFRDQFDVSEDFEPPRRWITDYARSKWESECRVRAASGHKLQTLILRPRAVFGEGDRAILPRLLAVAARGRFPLVGGGQALIDVTHIDNLVELIATCVHTDLPGNARAYNVSNGEPVRVRHLLETLFSSLGQEVRLLPVPRAALLALAALSERIARLRPGQPEPRLTRYGVGVIGYSQTLDISRAQRELHYQPQMGVADGIARYARWWKAHGHP